MYSFVFLTCFVNFLVILDFKLVINLTKTQRYIQLIIIGELILGQPYFLMDPTPYLPYIGQFRCLWRVYNECVKFYLEVTEEYQEIRTYQRRDPQEHASTFFTPSFLLHNPIPAKFLTMPLSMPIQIGGLIVLNKKDQTFQQEMWDNCLPNHNSFMITICTVPLTSPTPLIYNLTSTRRG